MAGTIKHASWVERAIVYGVIPRNFGDHGFLSVIEKLDYLHDLGINAIWLSPVNLSPPGDFGYAVVDYFDLQPKYGTKDDFRELVQQAHVRGIRVLMDFVPNHSSSQHPYFLHAETHGPASPYYDFYDRDAYGRPTHYFNWTHLPNLNYSNPRVQRWMLEAFAYWVREFDVDGFRVDVAWGIKQRCPEFWPRWREELTRIKPGLLLLAEASGRDPYYCRHGFDAAYDWTDELGHWAWEHVFEDPAELTRRLHQALTNEGRGFDHETLLFRFLNNNDTGARVITTYGPELTRVATAMLLTLPGIPCIYTGDEIGAAFLPYQDPLPIDWEDRANLREYYKQLIALRKRTPSLYSRHWLPLELQPARQVYGYLRYLEGDRDPVLVLLNFSGHALEVQLQLPERFRPYFNRPHLLDRLAYEAIPRCGEDTLHISLPAWGARVLFAPL